TDTKQVEHNTVLQDDELRKSSECQPWIRHSIVYVSSGLVVSVDRAIARAQGGGSQANCQLDSRRMSVVTASTKGAGEGSVRHSAKLAAANPILAHQACKLNGLIAVPK